MKKKIKKKYMGQILLHMGFVLIAIVYICPLLLVIAASFSTEQSLIGAGFSLFPKEFSIQAYEIVFKNPIQILNGYKTNMIYCTVNALLSVLVIGLTAYPLARDNFKIKNFLNFYFFFTMLFSGGLVPSYILNTRYLHLDDSIWIYIWPSLMSVYSMFVVRSNYQSVPKELIEAAKIDGAGEWYICFRIVMPLSKAILATVVFLDFVGNWNNWVTTSIYVRKPELYSLQYLLQRILREAEYVEQMAELNLMENLTVLPTETVRYATALVCAGPVLLVFPFFQKYFVKGMTVGSVKG